MLGLVLSTLLPARTTFAPAPCLSRQALLRGAAAAAGAAVVLPPWAEAVTLPARTTKQTPLKEDLVQILRVQEATTQETRLVKTGKYKELQRLNIKRAVGMMIDNYDIRDRFVRASGFARGGDVNSATMYGNTCTESLQQILEYFPSNLEANSLTPQQSQFVLAALNSASKNIDLFLGLMPEGDVSAAQKQVAAENELNLKEYAEVGELLNSPKVEALNRD